MPKIDYKRLLDSIQSSRLIGRDVRDYRTKAIMRFQGKDSPINMIEQYARIVTRGLVAKEPRVKLGTFDAENRPKVYVAQQWYNEEIQRQGLAKVFQKVTYDAYIKLGIAKTSLASPADLAVRGYAAEIASPLTSYVSFDDFAWDSRCTDFALAEWVGHRFRLPLDVAKAMKMYGPQRKQLTAVQDGRYNREGDLRASALNLEPYFIDAQDWCELWEIYLPFVDGGTIVTLADDQLAGASLGANGDPLREQKWIGPPSGPYSYMMFNPVPDQALPNGTLSSLLILDADLNELERKLIRQAKRQKSNTLVNASADKDNKTYKSADDGDLVPTDNPAAFVQVSRGGPDKVNNAFVMDLRDIINRLAGNLETMGGTSSQAKTLGQEQILNTNSSASLAEMLTECNRFAAQVCNNELWYFWYHPTKAMQTEYKVKGAPHISTMLDLPARDRHRVPFESLHLQVDPYSMPYRSPEQTLQTLTNAIVKIFVPLQPMMQAAGVTINIQRFAEMFGELQDMPEFDEIIETAFPQLGGSQDAPSSPSSPQQTRPRDPSEATQPGQDAAVRQALLGKNPGGAESTGGSEAA